MVWNGTTSAALLTNVESEAFSDVGFAQSSRTGDHIAKIELSNVLIPAHSELVMLQRGVHLHLTPNRPMALGDVFILRLAFADGSTRSVSGTVQAEGQADDIHHHDPLRPEWLRVLNESAGKEEET
ncbi:copper chaperone PCu(A)C [Aureimonas altamirensis]|nr:copper chaperone PCu(A)C [Aureimonas altamirensis]